MRGFKGVTNVNVMSDPAIVTIVVTARSDMTEIELADLRTNIQQRLELTRPVGIQFHVVVETHR